MTRLRWAWFAAMLLVPPSPGWAQLSGFNLFEFQVGNTPFTEPDDLTSGYDQLNVSYTQNAIQAAVRVEQFFTRFSERDYQQLSQYRLTYRQGGAEVTVGHFYEMLGRGLLLRAFEIPGVVFEDAAFRVRQGFYRDVHGVLLGYRSDAFAVKALRGKPLINVLPPTLPRADRRRDLLEAVDGRVHLGPYTLGGSFLRTNADGATADFAAISASGTLPLGFSIYTELAQQIGTEYPLLDYGDEARYAFYGSLVFTKAALGVSLEYKNYHDFFLGSGFNDPPSLIKEHPYAVLNRSTHVLNLIDERGLQLETYYRFPGGTLLTLNATRAVNELSRDFVYQEYFAEVSAPLSRSSSAKVFVDYAEDPFKAEAQRISAGTYLDRRLPQRWAATLDLEAQTFTRTFGDEERVTNLVAGLTVSKSTRYSAGVVWERSTDPFLTDDIRTMPIETDPRHWLGVNLGYRPNRSHTITLFAGTRRGGPACTSGICYEVLDFEGVELRVTSKF